MKIPGVKKRRRNRFRITFSFENSLKILKLKNIHQGEQCVITATGPSINQIDLSLIKKHPFVLGANGAFHIRNEFKYYFCSCPNFYLTNEKEIKSINAESFFFSSHIPFHNNPKYIYLKLHERTSLYHSRRFQPNLLKTLCWGPTVLLDLVLPTALWMGFSEILLLGADYSLQNYQHFYPENQHKTVKNVIWKNEMHRAHIGFNVLTQYLSSLQNPARIINCSPLSDLQCLEQAPLEKVVRVSVA
jgi:hypothetical protein